MPRSDSSGSSRKRRGTPRPTSEGKKSYGNKSSRPSRFSKGDESKPRFKRPSEDGGEGKRSSGRPEKKFSSGRSSGFKKRDEQAGNSFKRSSGDRNEKRPSGRSTGFKKRDDQSGGDFKRSSGDRNEKRPSGRSTGFKKRDDQSGGDFKRSSGDRNEKRPFGRSSGFTKRDDRAGDGFKRSSDRDEKRSFGPRDKKFNSERPSGFKKDTPGGKFQRPSKDGDEKRSFNPRDKKFSSDRSSGFKKSSEGRGEKRPYGNRDNKFSDRSENKRPSSRDDQSSDRRRPSPAKFDGADRERSSPSRRRIEKTERPSTSKKFEAEAPVQSDKIRLNKFIANSGVCSRREADEIITMGLISVNGKTITELGYKVNPGDEVRYESKVLRSEKPVYVLMNKPKGYLTTTNDPQERNTVMHIIGNSVKERIYPVGRLDRNTTGLLLLTNDGDLADKLMHPSYNAKKIYKVDLDRPLTKADFDRIVEGVQLEEGRAMVDDIAIISDDKKTIGLEIHIGWNRVVRRIFESLEYQVVKLDRSFYAGLDKKELPRGHWRFLTQEEVVRLKHYTEAAKKSKA
jgi:23S rRNA pseudouridine2605 synthase